jgi:hypothetical protein
MAKTASSRTSLDDRPVEFSLFRAGSRTHDVIHTLISLATLLLLAFLLAVVAVEQPEERAEITRFANTDNTVVVPEYPNVAPSSQYEWAASPSNSSGVDHRRD